MLACEMFTSGFLQYLTRGVLAWLFQYSPLVGAKTTNYALPSICLYYPTHLGLTRIEGSFLLATKALISVSVSSKQLERVLISKKPLSLSMLFTLALSMETNL